MLAIAATELLAAKPVTNGGEIGVGADLATFQRYFEAIDLAAAMSDAERRTGDCGNGMRTVSASMDNCPSAWLDVSPPATMARLSFCSTISRRRMVPSAPSKRVAGTVDLVDLGTAVGLRTKCRIEDDAAARG